MSKSTPRSALYESAQLRAPDAATRLERWLRGQRGAVPVLTAQEAHDPHRFVPTEEGSAIFGRWVVDADGLPAYRYELDQYADPAAAYVNTENLDRRDHWHQIGNQRVTGIASNDGVVQVYLGDRGGVLLNRFEAWNINRPVSFNLVVRLVSLILALIRLVTRRPPAPGERTFAPFEAQTDAAPPPRGALRPPESAAEPETADASAGFAAQAAPTPPQRDLQAVRYAHAGGFSYIDDGVGRWATAFRYRPPGALTRRVFGMGYFETETIYHDIVATRRVYAPPGDLPFLLADITLENRDTQPVFLHHYEYWDINVQQLRLDWVRTGYAAPASDNRRRALNRHFQPSIHLESALPALRFRQTAKTPPPVTPDQPSDIDWYPADIFLADLSGQPDAVYIRKAAFFGSGSAADPDAVRRRFPGDAVQALDTDTDDPLPYCLVMRRDLTLGAGERVTLRYAYGTVRPDESLNHLLPYREGQPAQAASAAWKPALAYFHTGADPVLHREMAWHSYNLLSAIVKNAFHKVFVVPQGSAYLYLHGADGAPRDQALFALPLTYLNPALARDLLRLIMRLTSGDDGQVWYAFAGHGIRSNGLNFHTKPSDLDIFFLAALAEYLAATGDYDFLDEHVPFYPPDVPPAVAADDTVRDHVRVKVRHLFEGIGLGDHGLLKVGSGDWSDSIVLETALRDGPLGVAYNNSKANGESVPNSQMALYALPLIAALLRQRAPDVAALAGDPARLDALRAAVSRQWNPRGWYHRAILRDALNQPVVLDRLELEAQPWALISGTAAAQGVEATLLATLDALDEPSPIGVPYRPGDMVWPAVSQLATWAYARCGRPDLAWRSLYRHTFAVHAEVYPRQWMNTWTGPDGINGTGAPPAQRGGTWSSVVTPMTDFPAMNANQDAMALLGLLRVCGVEPAPDGDGLTIRGGVPRPRWTLDLPLLRLDAAPGSLTGEYRAANNGALTLYVHLPPGAANLSATVQGQPAAAALDADGRLPLRLTFAAGDRVPFAVLWDV